VPEKNVTSDITYSIPISLVAPFRGRKMIVRAYNPVEIMENVTTEDLQNISYLKLLSLKGEIDSLMNWGHTIPVDLVVSDPYRDLPLLYRNAPLRTVHPIRVTVPLAPGFGNVVKLAVSLNFAVKVEGGQPDELLVTELQQLAHFYLHQSTVTEPVEFFHSLFQAFYHREPVTLWTIQEEDPFQVRYNTDQGEETVPGRLAGAAIPQEFLTFVKELQEGPTVGEGECTGCEFLMNCQGYFKWPRREYRCDGVKALLHILLSASEELRVDLASFQSSGAGRQP
jgi:hypothetical protein